MSRRLQRYKKHAKEGKLDQTIHGPSCQCIMCRNPSKNPPGKESGESTQKDSVQLEMEVSTSGTISEFLAALAGIVDKSPSRIVEIKTIIIEFSKFLEERHFKLEMLSIKDQTL